MSAQDFALRWLGVITAAYLYVCGMIGAYGYAGAWAVLH